jgi:hypothetical protein
MLFEPGRSLDAEALLQRKERELFTCKSEFTHCDINELSHINTVQLVCQSLVNPGGGPKYLALVYRRSKVSEGAPGLEWQTRQPDSPAKILTHS